MPKAATHILIGTTVAVITNCTLQLVHQADCREAGLPVPEFNFLELFSSVVAGFGMARLPDQFEPATGPRFWDHRGFFHSALVSVGVGAPPALLWKKLKSNPAYRVACAGAASFIAHNLADSTTKRGMPLVCRGF